MSSPGRKMVDHYRITLPVEVHGDRAARRQLRDLIAAELGETWTVEHRADAGIVIRCAFRRGATPDGTGAVDGAVAMLESVRVVLKRLAHRKPALLEPLDRALGYVELKPDGRGR